MPLEAVELKRSFPELRLLMLHGSSARGDAHPGSDWDFAYLADPGLDELGLRALLVRRLNTDAIDVADLHRAGAVLRYGAARDGQLMLEREAGEHERFRLAAIRFWLEIEPVLSDKSRSGAGAAGMTALDIHVLAERVSAVERHLAQRCPAALRDRPAPLAQPANTAAA